MGREPEPEVAFSQDERRWERIETLGDGYSPRTGHTVVPYGNMLYVFGGTDRRRRQQDLFQFDIDKSTWSHVAPKGILPPRRSGALGVVHEAKLYIFGGYDGRDGNYFNDLFFFDLETRMWSEMPSRPTQRPQARTDHIMVLHQSDIYVFGGYDGHVRYNNLHKYSIQDRNWSLIQPNGQLPSRRFGHSGATYINQGKLILFGGWDGRDTLNDLHSYDFEEQEWTQLRATGAKPSHRYRHTAVIYQDSMFIFGGVDKEHSRFNDLQRLDLTTNTWSEVCTTGYIPSSRTFHRAVVVGDLMYLLGGYDGTDRLDDLYSIHVGKITPTSLLELCAAYTRSNLNEVLKRTTFEGMPADVVDWVIWRRDADHALRGRCTQCPGGRCNYFDRSKIANEAVTVPRRKKGKGDSQASIDYCICGHSSCQHENVNESGRFTSESECALSHPHSMADSVRVILYCSANKRRVVQ